MNILKSLTIASVAVCMTAPAMATTTISFTNIDAEWFDYVGGTNVNRTGTGTGNTEIRWGKPNPGGPGAKKSGYGFTQTGPLSLVVDPATDTSAVTNIGKFTHFNYPIDAGTSITSVKLSLTTDVLVNGVFLQSVNFIYAFDHLETNNDGYICANGGFNNYGVNANGCADRVSVNFNQDSGFFTIDDVDYALDVRGFLLDDGSPADLFWTREKKSNSAYLRGQVVLRSHAGEPDPVNPVPEPATWAMMLGGFGLLGAAMRRRPVAVQFS